MSILLILNELLQSQQSKQQMTCSSKLSFATCKKSFKIKAFIIRKPRNIFYLHAYLYCLYNLLNFQVLASLCQFCHRHTDLRPYLNRKYLFSREKGPLP